jgi:hypothetical protein
MGLIPEGSSSMSGTVFPGGLVEAMLHTQLQVISVKCYTFKPLNLYMLIP